MDITQKRNALLGNTRVHHQQHVPSGNESTDDSVVSFIFISGDNGGLRYDWDAGEHYEEVLDVNGASYGRLNTFFKDHFRSVDSAIGRIENVAKVGGTIVGDVRFGTGGDERSVFRKYVEGILRDVSVGYNINAYTVEERDGQVDLVTITDFEIFEVSAVGIGFDGGATSRSSVNNNNEAYEARVESLENYASLL